MKCPICNNDLDIKFIPKGKIFLWRIPKGANKSFFEEKPFSLGTDYKTKFDLRKLECSCCGYVKYEKVN